jgi:hypothetical protein
VDARTRLHQNPNLLIDRNSSALILAAYLPFALRTKR